MATHIRLTTISSTRSDYLAVLVPIVGTLFSINSDGETTVQHGGTRAFAVVESLSDIEDALDVVHINRTIGS